MTLNIRNVDPELTKLVTKLVDDQIEEMKDEFEEQIDFLKGQLWDKESRITELEEKIRVLQKHEYRLSYLEDDVYVLKNPRSKTTQTKKY